MSDPKPNQPADGSASSGSKSFADVLLIVLEDYPRKFFKLLLTVASLAICLGVILFAFAWVIIRSLPSRASEIKFGPASVLFSQSESGVDRYLAVVPPQGWTRTSIFVPEGSILEIETGGKVHVDLSGLNRSLEARGRAEQRVKDEKLGKNANVTGPLNYAPEDFFTPEELTAMKPKWKWIGPDGISDAEMIAGNANPVRRQRAILPSEGYGVLIGAFASENVDPATNPSVIPQLVSGAFKIGSTYKQKVTVNRSGYLYLTVNDVQTKIPDLADMFLVDNIGMFFAKISVTK